MLCSRQNRKKEGSKEGKKAKSKGETKIDKDEGLGVKEQLVRQ